LISSINVLLIHLFNSYLYKFVVLILSVAPGVDSTRRALAQLISAINLQLIVNVKHSLEEEVGLVRLLSRHDLGRVDVNIFTDNVLGKRDHLGDVAVKERKALFIRSGASGNFLLKNFLLIT